MKRLTLRGSLLIAVIVVAVCSAAPVAAASFETLYSFTGASTGAYPQGPVVIGAGGVLYGTTYLGGTYGAGTVFSLTPPSSTGDAWTIAVLYEFTGGKDGAAPESGLVVGPGGTLYGTTALGGLSDFGAVFSLAPPESPGGAWSETVLYSFTGGNDGGTPFAGLLRATNGTLYGTTYNGGANNNGGVAFAVFPPSSPGSPWTEKVLHTFGGAGDGAYPYAGLITSGGLLYGTTQDGGSFGAGTVFSLAPPASAADAWTESVVYSFTGGSDGSAPIGRPASSTAPTEMFGYIICWKQGIQNWTHRKVALMSPRFVRRR